MQGFDRRKSLNAAVEDLQESMPALNLVTKGKATVELAANKLVYAGIYLPSGIRLPVFKHVPSGCK